jgi:hypothetical protein
LTIFNYHTGIEWKSPQMGAGFGGKKNIGGEIEGIKPGSRPTAIDENG